MRLTSSLAGTSMMGRLSSGLHTAARTFLSCAAVVAVSEVVYMMQGQQFMSHEVRCGAQSIHQAAMAC